MDIAAIKQLAIELRARLREHQIPTDCVILFGSQAREQAHAQSDIDFAVISRAFGRDRFAEGALLNRLAVKVHPDIEAIPIGLKDFLNPIALSPILHELKTTGTVLL